MKMNHHYIWKLSNPDIPDHDDPGPNENLTSAENGNDGNLDEPYKSSDHELNIPMTVA